MFTKRPDKHTTGLINMRNDCFANSSLQAYSSLSGLTEYLNDFITSFRKLDSFVKENKIDLNNLREQDTDSEKSGNQNPKFRKIEARFDIPLHLSLAKIIKKLQSTQMTSKTISVWTFLHEVEKIFNAKISRSQHDAQELTQLINETLENENIKIHKNFKRLSRKLQEEGNHELYTKLQEIAIPEFPFNGLILTQMQCLNCKGVSKPQFSPFLMLTLHTPQTISTDLETLLNDNESESIEGYQCLKCRIRYIVNNENYLKSQGNYILSDDETTVLEKIRGLDNDSSFCINEDLPEKIEDYIKHYSKNKIEISKITSTVLRKNQILKPPKIFGLHLSRSSFNGINITRNSCRVSFRDHLNLSIGKEYHEDLKQFQLAASQDDTMWESPNIKSKVLTTDVNDMEDAEVQIEDVEYKAETTDGEDSTDENADDETASDHDTDTSSIVTNPIHNAKSSSKSSEVSSLPPRTPDSLNNAPITEDQSDDLLTHFKKFKFNENDVYKYRLRAMIRHQGSHTQGHYECYKRKPLYVKDKEGLIIKLSPEISDELVDEADGDKSTISIRRPSNISSSSDSDHGTSRVGFNDPERSDILQNMNEDNIPLQSGNFRRKLSNMMGRRPSILQADPQDMTIEELVKSGTTTPAEFAVSDYPSDYFDLSSQINAKLSQQKEENAPVKLKKIPSLIKNPFWRISDSQITEVSKAAVLCETTSVYMLYYERVDRK